MEIWEEIELNEQAMSEAQRTLLPNWMNYCKAKQEYHIAKAKAILKLRTDGCPATLILDIVKGIDVVAELGYKRDIAEAIYKSNIEAINVYKQKANDLRMFFEKEYTKQ